VYFGTYTTREKSKGIYVSRLEPESGTLSPAELAAETPSPSFLAIDSTQRFLYAVNEVSAYKGLPTGVVSAFMIDRATGMLKWLNQQPSEGASPAHLTIDREGRNVLVANYGGGSVAVLPLGRDGKLKSASHVVKHNGSSVNTQRQSAPHAHSVALDPRD